MNLHDLFFSPAHHARAVPAPTRTIKIKVVGSNPVSRERLIADTTADLAFVSEDERLEALRLASDYIKATYKGADPDHGRRFDEEIYFLLACALRESSDPTKPFAQSAMELRHALVMPEALRLWDEYQRFIREEFPEEISPEEMAELVEEAKKKSLLDLLSSRGSGAIRSAWSFLVVEAGKSPPPTSGE